FLYTRVLGRISNERVRKVSHPGMVVRRMNREVLRCILDGPCKLGLTDDADANDLLAALRAEVSLLSVDVDGSLRFRSDLRVLAVPLLQREQPALVKSIHESAATYYGPRPEPASQSEYLYHLLALGDLTRANAVPVDIDLRIGIEIDLLPVAS